VRRYRAPLVVLAVLSLLLLIGACQQRATGPSAQASEARSLAAPTQSPTKTIPSVLPVSQVPTVATTRVVAAAEKANRLLISRAAADGVAQCPAASNGVLAVAEATNALAPTDVLTVRTSGHDAVYAPGSRLYSAIDQGGYQGDLSGNVPSPGMKQDLGPAASASLPPSTQPPASRTPDLASPTSVSPQTAGRRKPGPGFSIWELVGVAVIVVAVLGGVLVWVTRRRSPASGARHSRDWGLEPR
jgi:hypothetical protein